MEILRLLFLSSFLLCTHFVSSQIITNENEQRSKEKEVKKETKQPEPLSPKTEKDSVKGDFESNNISIFFEFSPANTIPELERNPSIFGKPLGEREFEKSENVWTYTLGFRLPLSNSFTFQSGVGYLRNRESYAFETVDSAYNYTTTYSYISMPFKLYYEYGSRLKVKAGVGVIAQMLSSYAQDLTYTTSLGNTESETIKDRDGLNNLVLSAAFSAGISYRYMPSFSIYFVPEYRQQLNSTYIDNHPYIHKVHALSFSFGLYYHL